MKKTIICSIPMKKIVDKSVYESDDLSVPVSSTAVRYPINAYLEKNVSSEDEVKIILLVKKDEIGHFEKNQVEFETELRELCKAHITITTIDTDFSQEKVIHEQLMGRIVDEIEDESHITVDITYGSKDIPILIFSALGFAEKFLDCEIDNIIYGQASFKDGHAVNTKICDMSPLYCLSSVTNTINCTDRGKARKTLESLLSL